MTYVRLDPPGQLLHYAAIQEILRRVPGRSFLSIGCGTGEMDHRLCEAGYQGLGIDLSKDAIEITKQRLSNFIECGRYNAVYGDILDEDIQVNTACDVVLALMVIEHLPDDVQALQRFQEFLKPDGYVVISVPARMSKWSLEDQTVGHLRRYSRRKLETTLRSAGLVPVEIWSVGVPVMNILQHASDLMIRRSNREMKKVFLDSRHQTMDSGIREVPFKTTFPSWFRLILNDVAMKPFHWTQRMFYGSDLGLELIAIAKKEPPST